MPSSTSQLRLRGSSRERVRTPWAECSHSPSTKKVSASSPVWPKGEWPTSWARQIASVRSSLSPSARAMARPTWVTWMVWVIRVTKWSPSGLRNTWVLCFRRRKALEWTIRSRSRSKAVRNSSGSSSTARPRDSSALVASSASRSCSRRSRSGRVLRTREDIFEWSLELNEQEHQYRDARRRQNHHADPLQGPGLLEHRDRPGLPATGDDAAAETGRDGVDDENDGDREEEDGPHPVEVPELHLLDQLEADAAGADRTQHRRCANVDLEPVEPVGDDHRHHLGQGSEPDLRDPAAPDARHGLHRPRVDALDGLGGELAEGADGVDPDGEDAGKRAEAGDRDEDHRQQQFRERPNGDEEVLDHAADVAVRDVASAEDGKEQRDCGGDHGCDPRHEQRLHDLGHGSLDHLGRHVRGNHEPEQVPDVSRSAGELLPAHLDAEGAPDRGEEDGQGDPEPEQLGPDRLLGSEQHWLVGDDGHTSLLRSQTLIRSSTKTMIAIRITIAMMRSYR